MNHLPIFVLCSTFEVGGGRRGVNGKFAEIPYRVTVPQWLTLEFTRILEARRVAFCVREKVACIELGDEKGCGYLDRFEFPVGSTGINSIIEAIRCLRVFADERLIEHQSGQEF